MEYSHGTCGSMCGAQTNVQVVSADRDHTLLPGFHPHIFGDPKDWVCSPSKMEAGSNKGIISRT
jgi:hypothetical protein